MDIAVTRAVSHIRNRAGAEMSGGTPMVEDRRNGKYRTAIILAVVALGLFVFTLYAGVK